MSCPKCGGEQWDNRASKKNRRSPDFKCKDKECGHAVWLEKKLAKAVPQANGAGKWTWNILSRMYRQSLIHAARHVTAMGEKYNLPPGPETIVAAAATIFIAATRDGIRDVPTPAPVPPPPPTREELDERPVGLDEGEDDLPFDIGPVGRFDWPTETVLPVWQDKAPHGVLPSPTDKRRIAGKMQGVYPPGCAAESAAAAGPLPAI